MRLPEKTEDGAPCNQGNQGQTVTQRVQGLHEQVENKLQTQKKKKSEEEDQGRRSMKKKINEEARLNQAQSG